MGIQARYIYGFGHIVVVFVFSTCGGVRTGSKQSVLTAYYVQLRASWERTHGLFVAPPLEDCLTGITSSSTRAGTGCTDFAAYR